MLLLCETFGILFLCQDKDICRFSDLHQCTFNLYFFIAFVGQRKSVLTRYLGTFLGFQNYELLDFILQCDFFSNVVQLKVKHQLLHNRCLDDQTSMKTLDFQRHTVNIRNSLIHPRKLILFFLIKLKNVYNFCRIFMKHSGNIPIFNIAGTLLGNFPRTYIVSCFRIFREYIMRMLHEYSMNIYLSGGIYLLMLCKRDNSQSNSKFG